LFVPPFLLSFLLSFLPFFLSFFLSFFPSFIHYLRNIISVAEGRFIKKISSDRSEWAVG
jgi:hypothetical protein